MDEPTKGPLAARGTTAAWASAKEAAIVRMIDLNCILDGLVWFIEEGILNVEVC